jgi:hypothetical protein
MHRPFMAGSVIPVTTTMKPDPARLLICNSNKKPMDIVTGITEPAMKRDSETPCRDGACFAPGPGLYILHLLS